MKGKKEIPVEIESINGNLIHLKKPSQYKKVSKIKQAILEKDLSTNNEKLYYYIIPEQYKVI